MIEKITKKEKEIITETKKDEDFSSFGKKAFDAVFDNTHKTDKYQKVYEEIETQTLPSFEFSEGIETSSKNQKESLDATNPFFGDKDAIFKMSKKHSYSEVVDAPQTPEPKLEIKEKIEVGGVVKESPSTKRQKLWMIVGGILIALFLAVFGYNMFSLNSFAKKITEMEHKINEQEQTLDQNQNSNILDNIE